MGSCTDVLIATSKLGDNKQGRNFFFKWPLLTREQLRYQRVFITCNYCDHLKIGKFEKRKNENP